MRIDELVKDINEAMFQETGCDELLDLRDDEGFDSQWVRLYEAVEGKKQEGYSDELIRSSDACREQVYIKAYDLCGNRDLAACISDDFGLLFDCEALQYTDPLADKMVQCYAQSKMPCD